MLSLHYIFPLEGVTDQIGAAVPSNPPIRPIIMPERAGGALV